MSRKQASKRRRHERKACKRKRRFGGSQAAAVAATMGVSYYRCGVCRGFHLTKRRRDSDE